MPQVSIIDRAAMPDPLKEKDQNISRCGSFESIGRGRPFIASPFMPIPTQRSVDPDRRSVVGSFPRDNNRNVAGYGSTTRSAEAGLLKKQEIEESSEDEDEDEESSEDDASSVLSTKRSSLFDLSSKEWVTIVMLALANLCSTVAFSCIAPFYPAEAATKGMSESQTGMVFGVFELTMFITAPIFGKYMTHIGSKKMFVIGLTITGICAILFGFLNFLPSGPQFFWCSLLIRVLEAVGDAAFVTSSFAISAKCFPGRITVVVGIMETFAGLGYTAGPLIGGFLYEFGGFQTPFLVLGAILLMATALSLWLIEDQEDDEPSADAKGMLAMLRIPVIWIMVYAIVVCAISMSFLDPTLSAHLSSFKLSPTMVGLMFLLCGGIYTLTAPVWGILIDRYHCSTAVMLFGSVMTVISMLLIGPAPFIPLEKSLVLIGLSLAVLGVAAGAQYIPTFQSCLDAVKAHGYDDSFQTYGCVSGLFQSAFAFGAFFGPTVGGFSVERIGFAWTCSIIALVHVFFIITVILFYGTTCCISKRRNTTT